MPLVFYVFISDLDWSLVNSPTSFPTPDPGCIPLTLYFTMYSCISIDLHQWIKSWQHHPPASWWLTLGPGLNMYLCDICNTKHTALSFLALNCLHFQNYMQTTLMGGGMCSHKLGCTSAVCVVTLLEPLGSDLIPTGHQLFVREEPPSFTQAWLFD